MLDRFSQGRKDPQAELPVCYCPACGGEIYHGESVWQMDDGSIIHADKECLMQYINPKKVVA